MLHLSFDSSDRDSTHVYDLSNNANNGIINGNVEFEEGIVGDAIRFDGNGDFVRVLESESLDFGISGTVAFWTKFTDTSSYAGFIHKGHSNAWDDEVLDIHVTGTSGKIFSAIKSENSRYYLDSVLAYDDDNWHSIIFTWGSGSYSMFVDGNLVEEKSSNIIPKITDGDLMIGTQIANDYYFKGLIDEVKIYNRKFTVNDVLDYDSIDNNGKGDVNSGGLIIKPQIVRPIVTGN